MSVRPAAKGIQISSVSSTVVQLSTTTAADFEGDQFILMWNGTATESGAIQQLGIFLNPPYTRPTGSNVKVMAAPADLTGDLSTFDTLDIEGTVAVASTGAVAFVVPANINNIFLGPAGWLQGKLRFTQSGLGNTRKIYSPGVLDVSRFNYANRHCDTGSASPNDGYQSISWIPRPNKIDGVATIADGFIVDGLIVSDSDFYASDWFNNTTINGMKINGWNGNNDGIQMGITVRVSNEFIHTGDDSLKMWGSYITVTNATVCSGMERRRDQPGLVRQLAGGRLPDRRRVRREDGLEFVQHAQLDQHHPEFRQFRDRRLAYGSRHQLRCIDSFCVPQHLRGRSSTRVVQRYSSTCTGSTDVRFVAAERAESQHRKPLHAGF
jgi:hypothetical protein